jgi:hygromycin-B 7''-O-kinase
MKDLELLDNLDHYRHLFTSVDFWQPAVEEICRRHNLAPDGPVRIGVPGTCPTFIVGERWVVKFFGRLFEGGESFAIEKAAGALAAQDPAIPIATVLAHGFLREEDWPWPYLVYAFIPGASLGELAEQITAEDWLNIARELGETTRRLHALPLSGSPVFPDSQQPYLQFLQAQRAAVVEHHRQWGSLPPHLIEQIEYFIPPLETLITPGHPAHLIHADLTRDHLLGNISTGHWQTLGLIDFGDAMTGDLLYELAALHMDLFRGDRRLLSVFLDAYGIDSQTRASLPRKALATSLLHQFDLFSLLPEVLPDAPSLEALAVALWGDR